MPGWAAQKRENRCAPQANEIVVRFTYGSEKENWIYPMTERFNQEGHKTTSGKKICINALPKGSGDSVNEIRNGQPGPTEVHATSPASDLYVNLINYEHSQTHGSDLLQVEGFLVSSPVVIAAWEPVVKRLESDGGIGWLSLFQKSQDSALRYGQTNPERSNSGLSALVAQFYAGAQRTGNGSVRRLSTKKVENREVRDFVARMHENVIHYGKSTGFYAEKMRKGGPQYADAVVIYESDVVQANNTIRQQKLGHPRLVAVYPKEGTFATNHPFAIVKRDWVDVDEEEGAKRYFEFLMSPEIQAEALQYGFRPGVALDIDPGIYEMVWNEANGVKPFDSVHQFLATPNGNVVKAILDAFRKIKNKSLVSIVIDKSGSMEAKVFDEETGRKRSRMSMAVESTNLLADRLQDKDRLSLLLYDYRVYYADITPKGQPLAMTAQGKEQLQQALQRVSPKGGTAMRDAIDSAWNDVCSEIKADASNPSIRLIVVLTDGNDNASRDDNSTDKLIKRIGFGLPDGRGGYYGDPACKIPIFGIAFGGKADDRSLRAIAEATGGEARHGDSAEIRHIFERFSDLL
jgi:Ca-activated chloride channel family protein